MLVIVGISDQKSSPHASFWRAMDRSNLGLRQHTLSGIGRAYLRLIGHKVSKMRPYRPPSWKYRELVAAFDGDANVADLIRAAGFEPPPIKTIAGWRMRNSVPAAWLPLLIEEALDRGLLDSLSQLRREAA